MPNKIYLDTDYYCFRAIDREDRCEGCNGSGTQVYGSTATWCGGIGGAAMTEDVCDKCWGSGKKHRPWPSWKLYREKEKRVNDLQKALTSANKIIAEAAGKADEEARKK